MYRAYRNPESDVVVFDSTQPEYGQAKAYVAVGQMAFLGERYLPDGTLRAAFSNRSSDRQYSAYPKTDIRRNPSVQIGREFFTTALRDYQEWEEKWWREAIQNAVDAGGTTIVCTVCKIQTAEGQEANLIEVEDNGKGMPLDTILNKFLVLGGSTKETTQGSFGGFGKAKELLILPWLTWKVESQNTVVEGSGIDYNYHTVPTFKQGTKLSVVMPNDKTTTGSRCMAYLHKCYLPRIKFLLFTDDGNQPVTADGYAGDLVTTFGDGVASLHVREIDYATHYMNVRIAGPHGSLYMFNRYLSQPVDVQPTVEIHGSSIEYLTANRDGFRDRKLGNEIEAYIGRIAVDRRSALRAKKGQFKRHFKGTGRFTAAKRDELRAKMLGSLSSYGQSDGRQLHLSDEQKQAWQEIVNEETTFRTEDGRPIDLSAVLRGPEVGLVSLGVLPSLVATLLDVPFEGPLHIENAIKVVSWAPDFYLENEVEGLKLPKKYFPETMAVRVKNLAQFWAELCRFVLIQINCPIDYGVGFTFDTNYQAKARKDSEGTWLLLNPIDIRDGFDISKQFKVSDRDHALYMYALAVHECTHLQTDTFDETQEFHGEDYANALTANFAKTAGSLAQLNKIIRALRE